MSWLAENWPWILFGVAFVGLHLVGHGGHGGHGGRGDRGPVQSKDKADGADPRDDGSKPPHGH
ncbi:DUF2933 domain-containing protein [Brevundimonas aurifodinae]|uniref:DUF2933 domain-containing protein n=1 Tax=Brevundimonas aurifodinae TaxID=1508312 RepID=UPI003D80C72A